MNGLRRSWQVAQRTIVIEGHIETTLTYKPPALSCNIHIELKGFSYTGALGLVIDIASQEDP